MASNSPGKYTHSNHGIDNQRQLISRPLLPDITIDPGNFHMNVGTGFQGDASFIIRDSGYNVSTSDGASTCSSSTTETWDLEGGNLLVLESKSLRSFTTNDEYLFAMKEDLADWFSSLYQSYDITADNIFQVLETGILLCKHANKVQEFARQSREMGESLEMRSYFIRSVPEGMVPYREGVKPETFQARDNVSNFISWTRELGIPQFLSFETDDLVLRKNEKSVILCLLEVARVGAKLGMLAPTLIQMEQEIDAELSGEEPQLQVQIKTCDLRSLDERVRDLIGRCTCPIQFPMVKVGDGKYKIGDTRSLIFVRILRSHVMVRVGGGWDTLENYLNKHDPCQCNYRGHRSGTPRIDHKVSANQLRRSSISTTFGSTPNIQTPPRQITSTTPTSINRSASPQTTSRSGSPSAVVKSSNIPATPLHDTSITSSSKGTRIMSNQKHQIKVQISSPRPSISSSNSNSSSQLIRSNSPTLGHLSSAAALRASHNVSSSMSSISTLSKGKDAEHDNKHTLRKNSLISFVRSSFDIQSDLQGVRPPSNLEQASVPDPANFAERKLTATNGGDKIRIRTQESQPVFGSVLPLLQDYSLSHESQRHHDDLLKRQTQINPAQTLQVISFKTKDNSSHMLVTPDTVTVQTDHTFGAASEISSSGITQTQVLSQFSESEKDKLAYALSTNKSRPHTSLQINSVVDKTIVKSHPKTQSSSFVKTPKLSPNYGQKMEINLDKVTDNILAVSEKPGYVKRDAETTVACAITHWLESTNEMDHKNLSSTKIPSANLIESFRNMPPKSFDDADKNKHEEVFHRVSPQAQISGGTIKTKPARTSHIPKLHYFSNSRTAKTAGSVPVHSSKKKTGSSDTSSKVCSGLSSFKSLNDISLSPTSTNSNHESTNSNHESTNSNPESCKFENSFSPASEHSNISDNWTTKNSNNYGDNSEDICADKTNVTPEKYVTIPTIMAEMLGAHDNLNVSSGSVKSSARENRNIIPNSQRRYSVGTTSHTRVLNVLKDTEPLHRTSSISHIQTEQQTMLTNDITFSDDEEINELIKNSGLKEKTIDTKIHSSNTSRKLPNHKSEKNNVLMIRRDKSGHHAVHMTNKNELKHSSTPKSSAARKLHPITSSSLSSSEAVSRPGSKTPNPTVSRKKMSVDSSPSKNRIISHTKQGKDIGNEVLAIELSGRPLEEIQAMLTETKTSLMNVDIETLQPPEKDLHMFKKMEKIFEKYREVELKATVEEISGGEFRAETSVESAKTSPG